MIFGGVAVKLNGWLRKHRHLAALITLLTTPQFKTNTIINHLKKLLTKALERPLTNPNLVSNNLVISNIANVQSCTGLEGLKN